MDLNRLTLTFLPSTTNKESLLMFFESLKSLKQLKTLHLQIQDCLYLCDHTFSSFSEFLANAKTLRDLNVSFNIMYVRETSLLIFATSLKNLSLISALRIHFEYLYSVSDKVLYELGNSLTSAKSLEEFQINLYERQDRYIDMLYGYFQYKWLSDLGLKDLFRKLSKITSLRKLKIELLDCQLFSDSVLVSIGESFGDTKMLKELVIKASNCRHVNYEAITKYLSSFIRLEKLELDLTKKYNNFEACPISETVDKLPYLSADTCKIILNSYYTWFSAFSS